MYLNNLFTLYRYGNTQYPNITPQNKNFYKLGNHYALTTKVLFIGNIDKYRDEKGNYPTYENAV